MSAPAAHRSTAAAPEDTMTTLTIGFTQTDRILADYVPSMDGYRHGAAQDVVEAAVPAEVDLTPKQWAEAVFVATNAPDEASVRSYPGGWEVYVALADRRATLRALSIGDTVTVEGKTLACARVGWVEVSAA